MLPIRQGPYELFVAGAGLPDCPSRLAGVRDVKMIVRAIVSRLLELCSNLTAG
ncbi:hypothetical protein HZZ16_00725 [Bradyrhizobium sp. CNPSo 4016]|nr:hypothetical protein [Bradyrhizobium glycinis]